MAKKKNSYWSDRLLRQNQFNFKRSAAASDKKLAQLYKKTAENIVKDINKLYSSLNVAEDEIKINDLYKNNQYYKLLSNVNRYLNQLGEEEIKITDETLLDMYNKTSSLVANQVGFQVGFEDAATNITNRIWCKDGLNWSDRIWRNKRVMQSKLEQGLTDCVVRGYSKDKVVTELTNVCGVQRRNAERLVRTELTHIQNEAAADTYKKAGITHYEYISAEDERVSEECEDLNGQIFAFDEAEIGVNFPPMHANCRCTIVPVIE